MGWLESLAGPLIGGALNFIGGENANEANAGIASANNAFNADQAAQNREFNAGQAELNRTFQQRMANTAYQRAMSDMKDAGLNPMLAFSKGGADVPGGSTASGTAATSSGNPQMQNTLGPAASSAIQMATAQQNLENMQAEKDRIEAEAMKARAEAFATSGVRTEQARATADRERSAVGVNETSQVLNITSAARLKTEIPKIEAETKNAIQSLDLLKEQTSHERIKQIATSASTLLTMAQEQLTNGQITLNKYLIEVQKAEELIRNANVSGAAEDAKFQAAFGQMQRIIKMINPLSGIMK